MPPHPSLKFYQINGERESNYNILVIEDRESDIELIEEALKDSNFPCNLYITTNGEEALNFLSRRNSYRQVPRPHLILLDLNLPRMSGLEVLSIVKQEPILKLIPLVVLTTSSNPTDVINSYRLHANCYIVKPGNLDHFFTAIREIVNYWFTIATLPQLNNDF